MNVQTIELTPGTLVGVILSLIAVIFASAGFWSFLSARMARKDKKEDDREQTQKVDENQDAEIKKTNERVKGLEAQITLQSQMLRGIGHDRIIYLGGVFLKQGYVTTDEFENLHDYLFLPYQKLGGNGTAEKVMAEVEKLPTKPPIYPDIGGEYK